MPTLRAVHEDRTLRLVTCESLVIAVWSDAPDLPQMRALGAALRTQARAFPRANALMNVVVRGTPNFSEPVRKEALRLARDPSLAGVGSAHLILMGGLTGVATRAFLSTVALVGTTRATPVKVFSEAAATAEWLADRLATTERPLSRDDILALHEQAIAGR
jgi:hypothetical protein